MRVRNRDRILVASLELFNAHGVVAVTTNHIAKHLSISPGNLYFHYANKEEILRELFRQMSNETFQIWKDMDAVGRLTLPMEFLDRHFDVYYKYRFFHREMYHLRRKDSELGKQWKNHVQKIRRMLAGTYVKWVENGVMRKLESASEMHMISEIVLITSSTYLQFFEGDTKPASRRQLRQGTRHIARFLLPYHTPAFQEQVQKFLA